MSLIIPGTVSIPVGVVVERRPGVTQWAEWAWRAVEVLEDAPVLPAWMCRPQSLRKIRPRKPLPWPRPLPLRRHPKPQAWP